MTNPADTAAQPNAFTPTSDLRGRYLWYDLMTPDIDAAVAFYGKVTGWTTTPFTPVPGQPSYTMWTNAAGEPMGGTMTLPAEQSAAGVPAHWIAYVGTPDVDATAADAVALGATTQLPPTDVPTVGRVAVLADPQGAFFALYAPANALGPMAERPGVGNVSWHELYTTDPEAAFAFYQKLFGWAEASSMDLGAEHGRYLMFGRGGQHMYGGMMKRPSDRIPPIWTPYIRVPDVDAAAAAVRANGGQVLNGPMEVPGGDRVAQCLDPAGAPFGVHQMLQAAG